MECGDFSLLSRNFAPEPCQRLLASALMMKAVDDTETVPDSALLPGTLVESSAWEATSDKAAVVAVLACTSLQLFTFPPESVFTI